MSNSRHPWLDIAHLALTAEGTRSFPPATLPYSYLFPATVECLPRNTLINYRPKRLYLNPNSRHKPQKINLHVIAATNRQFPKEVAAQRFRECLFHRLVVGVFQPPLLREGIDALGSLIDYLFDRINRNCVKQAAWVHKTLSAGARKLLALHLWPGNIRETSKTPALQIGLPAKSFTPRKFVKPCPRLRRTPWLPIQSLTKGRATSNQGWGDDLNLAELVAESDRYHLIREYDEVAGQHSATCTLVGLPNYQTFGAK